MAPRKKILVKGLSGMYAAVIMPHYLRTALELRSVVDWMRATFLSPGVCVCVCVWGGGGGGGGGAGV